MNKPRQAFLMVNKQRCDTFIASQLIGMSAIKRLGLEKTVAGIPEALMERIPYHLMISKNPVIETSCLNLIKHSES